MDASEFWHWVERVAGILFVVCFCLYVLRCAVAQSIIGIDQFGRFVQALLHFLRT